MRTNLPVWSVSSWSNACRARRLSTCNLSNLTASEPSLTPSRSTALSLSVSSAARVAQLAPTTLCTCDLLPSASTTAVPSAVQSTLSTSLALLTTSTTRLRESGDWHKPECACELEREEASLPRDLPIDESSRSTKPGGGQNE
ncbi:hypothetical protein CBOM_03456 [Ceraceosorus bombacis]|uniref:Uncharacterized protein n=1 Tax=Ceraceosorus bombacis TaxID=401625 RepID=A0A0P1BMJ9_9BASI|nr:hypothetical protein CBOM_03456 [Ceraceosorus bombacis]